jgi:hypothetical protein
MNPYDGAFEAVESQGFLTPYGVRNDKFLLVIASPPSINTGQA